MAELAFRDAGLSIRPMPFLRSVSILSFAVIATLSPLHGQKASALPVGFEERQVKAGDTHKSYLLLAPSPVEAQAKYPVLLFLHGAGERGTDNRSQIKHFAAQMAQPAWRKKYPCYLIAPQCEPNQQWVMAPWGDKKSTPMAKEPSAMLRFAFACLDQVLSGEAAHIDPKRIYVTGLSMGGYGTWEAAARRPELFAAAAPICGGGDELTAGVLKALPIWAWHGDKDTVVWPERSQSMVEAIKAAGGNPKITLLPGVHHDSWTPAYAESSGLLDWLFSQKKP